MTFTIYTLSATIASIGMGVMTTWNPDTILAKLFGYQILYMFGIGLGHTHYDQDSWISMAPRDQFIANHTPFHSDGLGTALALSVVQNILNIRIKHLVNATTSDEISHISHSSVSIFTSGIPAGTLTNLESKVQSIYSSSMTSSLYLMVTMSALMIIPAVGSILSGLKENRRKRRSDM